MTGVAIPFYLAHPRLAKLEETMMLEVEGGTDDVVHEDPAPRGRPRHRQRVPRCSGGASASGSSAATRCPIRSTTRPKPYSKSYVLHLDMWYAQSHPAEDFAETFAVWLTPDADWRQRYQDWPALKKLEYMEELMRGPRGQGARW